MRATKTTLTCDLIRVASGTGRKVWLTPTAAKALSRALNGVGFGHPDSPVVVADNISRLPKGTLFLVPADGVTGWRVRSKAFDAIGDEDGSFAQSDEFYAETARGMELALSAATWALNVAANHPTGTR